MKLLIDMSKVQFSVIRNPEARNDQNGKQRFSKDGALMWQTQIQAVDEQQRAMLCDPGRDRDGPDVLSGSPTARWLPGPAGTEDLAAVMQEPDCAPSRPRR